MKTTKNSRSADRAERALFYFSTAQKKGLQAAARRLGTSRAALVRQAIDLIIANSMKARKVSR